MTAPETVETDFGWALGTVMRNYMQAAGQVMVGVPGGPRGYQVLAACGREGPRTQLALAHQLGLDRTVMTYLLDDLQKEGLVERRPDPADRRARRVELTDGGRARLCELAERLAETEERLLERLEPDERESLRRMLFRLATGSDTTTGELCTMAEEITSQEC
ncbi:MarR family winged helix-turn-helix transcriptional regulator [Pseudonocardia lacus]|uniref:MarR family winged helix-turn-helix transcriptional regulator n=1 Tax=Pseudonocardia lacus TaxID=2835865 RepID=UPI0027E23AAF|nr:MarR family winged helix-turn-helix transcriptional regulator [Pseudonocardia lacus]